MKARVIVPMLLVTAIMASNIAIAHAASNATITITMAGPAVVIDIVDISAAPASWEIKPVQLNSSYSKAFTLTNSGNVRVDTTIVGTDASGSGYHWVLDDHTGNNQYIIEYNVEGQTGTYNVITTPVDFVQNLAVEQSKNFLLTVKTPTAGELPEAGEAMQATITIHAVKG